MSLRPLLTFILAYVAAFAESAPELNDKFHDSGKCKPCHMRQVKTWERSYHALSHYDLNEYLKKSMDYYSRKTREPLNAVKVKCAVCHNPRIAVTKTGIQYKIDVLMGLDKGSKVNQAVKDTALTEGVNCLVCHNVDDIHEHLPESKRGADRIAWNPVGTMSGPFADANSPYHKTQHRDFFDTKPEKLCFVCHANDRSVENVVFTDMKSEYKTGDQTCTDCHMGPRRKGFASNLPIENGKPKPRMVRDHNFVGAHVTWMWEAALKLSAKPIGDYLLITIDNDNPHNIPTGFGARELVLDVVYRRGDEVLEKKRMFLTQEYRDKRGRVTIPHLAKTISKDMSIPAKGDKKIKVPIIQGTAQVMISLSYRLVNGETRKLLELKDPIWRKLHPIDRTLVHL